MCRICWHDEIFAAKTNEIEFFSVASRPAVPPPAKRAWCFCVWSKTPEHRSLPSMWWPVRTCLTCLKTFFKPPVLNNDGSFSMEDIYGRRYKIPGQALGADARATLLTQQTFQSLGGNFADPPEPVSPAENRSQTRQPPTVEELPLEERALPEALPARDAAP